jgi:hypothetical protein
MFRCMIAGTTAAATVGIGAAMISASIVGTAGLPFVLGSSFGFVLGSWRWYATAVSQASASIDLYPALLRLHLLANFPTSSAIRKRPLREFNSANFNQGWETKSMLVAGWLSAGPALDAIQTQAEAALVDEYAKDAAESNTGIRKLTIEAAESQ